MTERESKIREAVHKACRADSNVSRDYNLLSVNDTCFLLAELDRARGEANVLADSRIEVQYDGYAYVVVLKEKS